MRRRLPSWRDMLRRRSALIAPVAIAALLLASLAFAVLGNDAGPPKPDYDAPPLSPAHEGAVGAYGMFTRVGGQAVARAVDRARRSLDDGQTRGAMLARVRQDLGELLDDDATGEVGDTDVCEQVAAALSEALVAHGEQAVTACDEILDL
jgi:hypothetical protein